MKVELTDKEIELIGRTRNKPKAITLIIPMLAILLAVLITMAVVSALKANVFWVYFALLYFIPYYWWITRVEKKQHALGRQFLEQTKRENLSNIS